MQRKEFIKSCSMICIGGIGLLESCSSSNYYAQNTISNNRITLKKSEFVQVKTDGNIQRNYVLIKIDKYKYPLCIYKLDESNYSALLMRCSHKGCELNPQGDFLVCPCHGSEFSNKGVVQNPPAEQNLTIFTTTSDNENIYIHL